MGSAGATTIDLSPSYFPLGEEVDLIVEKFETAWESGKRPPIEEFLPVNPNLRSVVLVELAHVDMERRIKAGAGALVESYLERFPELSRDHNASLQLIGAEYSLRQRFQGDISLEEYLLRFPHYTRLLVGSLSQKPPRPAAQADFGPTHISCPFCQQPLSVTSLGKDEPKNENDTQNHIGPQNSPQNRPTRTREVRCPHCHKPFRIEPDLTVTWRADDPPQVGRFELLELAGTGSFGAVYRAYDSQLERIVAIKRPRASSFHDEGEERRFVQEAKNVAKLAHPGIVQVYEVGHTGELPYIVSEFVEGETLADALKQRRFDVHEAAQLTLDVAAALHHAHCHGVVHRDLKPSNILLETVARAPFPSFAAEDSIRPQAGSKASVTLSSSPTTNYRVRLTDFGLARRDDEKVTVTHTGQVLGTPAYMSPEQATGEAHHADGRADTYSLGVILYEMLTGETPFRGNSNMLVQQVIHEEPQPPRRLNDAIARDLETICLKCLEKRPERRYPTCEELGSDLRRFLSGQPIKARPVGWIERQWRWWAKRPQLAALIAFIVFGTLAAFVGIGWQLKQKTLAQNELEKTNEDLETVNQRLQAQEQAVRDQRERVRDRLQRITRAYQLADASRKIVDTHPLRSMLLARHGLQLTDRPQENRVVQAEQALRDALHTRGGGFPEGFAAPMVLCAESANGKRLCRRLAPDRVEIWDMEGDDPGSTKRTLTAPWALAQAKLSPNSRWLALFDGKRRFRLFDLESPDPQHHALSLSLRQPVWKYEFGPQSGLLAVAGQDGAVGVWRLPVDGGRKLFRAPLELSGNQDVLLDLEISSDEKWLAARSEGNTTYLWRLDRPNLAQNPVARKPKRLVHVAAAQVGFTGDNRWLLTIHPRPPSALFGRQPRLWPLADPSQNKPQAGWVLATGFPLPFDGQETPDGRWLVVVSKGARGKVQLAKPPPLRQTTGPISVGALDDSREASAPKTLSTIPVVERVGEQVEVSKSGRWLAVLCNDGTLAVADLWQDNPSEGVISIGHRKVYRGPPAVLGPEVSRPDGEPKSSDFLCFNFSCDERRLVAGDASGGVLVWDLPLVAGAKPRFVGQGDSPVNVATLADPGGGEGRWLISGDEKGLLRFWDLRSKQQDASPIIIRRHESAIDDIKRWPGRNWILSTSTDKMSRLWDLSKIRRYNSPQSIPGNPLRTARIPFPHPFALGPTSESRGNRARWLLTSTATNQLQLTNLAAAGSPSLLQMRQPNNPPHCAAISDDARWLAVGANGGALQLWETAHLQDASKSRRSREETVSRTVQLPGHQDDVLAVGFSADGRWFASASRDGIIQLWRRGKNNRRWMGKSIEVGSNGIDYLAFSPCSPKTGRSRWLLLAQSDMGSAYLAANETLRAGAYLLDLSNLESGQNRIGPPVSDQAWTRNRIAAANLLRLSGADGAPLARVSMGPQGRWLVTINQFGAATLWDLTADNPAMDPQPLTHEENTAFYAVFSHTGRWLAIGNEEFGKGFKILLWDLSADVLSSRVLAHHTGPVTSVVFSANDSQLISSGMDRTIALWTLSRLGPTDPPTTNPQPRSKGESHLSPDTVLRGHSSPVLCLAHWQGGRDRLLASGDEDGEIRLWRLEADVWEPVVLKNDWAVEHLLIGADGGRLIAQGPDGSFQWWRLSLTDLCNYARTIAGRELSDNERLQYFLSPNPKNTSDVTSTAIVPGR